jgi:hypothetical protein
MFLASFEKLFLLIGIIVAVWYGFKFFSAVERATSQTRQAPRQRPGAGARPRPTQMAEVEETSKCRVCGAYVPVRQPARCGRPDCPY